MNEGRDCGSEVQNSDSKSDQTYSVFDNLSCEHFSQYQKVCHPYLRILEITDILLIVQQENGCKNVLHVHFREPIQYKAEEMVLAL